MFTIGVDIFLLSFCCILCGALVCYFLPKIKLRKLRKKYIAELNELIFMLNNLDKLHNTFPSDEKVLLSEINDKAYNFIIFLWKNNLYMGFEESWVLAKASSLVYFTLPDLFWCYTSSLEDKNIDNEKRIEFTCDYAKHLIKNDLHVLAMVILYESWSLFKEMKDPQTSINKLFECYHILLDHPNLPSEASIFIKNFIKWANKNNIDNTLISCLLDKAIAFEYKFKIPN